MLKQPLSLLDQKKLQWAKEKEELNGLWSPWGRPSGQTPGYVQQDESTSKRRTSGPLITLSTVNKLCGLTNCAQSEYHLPPIIRPGNQQSPETGEDCVYCNGDKQDAFYQPGFNSLLKRKSSLPASMEAASGDSYERNKKSYTINHAELTEHQSGKNSIMKQALRDRYDEHNFTSGYQSEVFGEEFGSRNGSGDSERLVTSNGKDYYSLQRPSHAQTHTKRSKETESYSKYTAESDRRHSYSSNQPNYGTWHSTTQANSQTLPSAMRSSFTSAIEAPDSNAFRDVQQREKQEWLYELEKQREEQRQRKLMEKDESRPKWGDRGVVVGHLWEPSDVATARLPQRDDNSNYSQYPGWVEKSPNLKRMTSSGPADLNESRLSPCGVHSFDVLVEPQQQYLGNSEKTFIRGQNVPIDPDVFAEREKKRVAALKHQEEIRKQMEERQFQLKIDREKRLAEERLDEERIAMQRREELRRLDIEKRQISIADDEKDLEPETRYDPMIEHQRKKAILDKVHNRKTFSPENQTRELQFAETTLQQEQDRITEMENSIIGQRRNSLTLPLIQKNNNIILEFETLSQDAMNVTSESRYSPANRSNADEPTLRSRSLTRESAGTQTDETRILEDGIKTSVKSKSTTNLLNPTEPVKKKEKPRWGVVPPKVQYVKQSEKDPNFHLRQKRKNRMKRREEQLKHVTLIDTESEDGRQAVPTKAAPNRQPLKANHSSKPSNSKIPGRPAAPVEENCVKEATYYTTTIRPAASYRTRTDSNPVIKYKNLTQQERLLLQAYENEDSAAESSQLSSSPASYEKELDFQLEAQSVLITDEEIRISRSETKKRSTTMQKHDNTLNKTKATKTDPNPKKKPTVLQKKVEAVIIPILRTNSPPVPALLKKMQEQSNLIQELDRQDNASPPLPDFIKKLDDIISDDAASFLSSENTSEDLEREFENKTKAVSTRIRSNKSKISSNTHILDMPVSDYEKIPHIPDVSPRYLSHIRDASNERPATKESEVAQREKIISYVMQNEEVQAELSARESELSSRGIIEFSIKLPTAQPKVPKASGLKTTEGKKAVKQVTNHLVKAEAYAYLDPLESERRRATINWVNSKENGKGILSHLSQLKQGIKQQQHQWGVVPVDSAEETSRSSKNYPY